MATIVKKNVLIWVVMVLASPVSAITVSMSSIDFGDTLIFTAATQTITIANHDPKLTENLSGFNITNAAFSKVSTTCGTPKKLKPGESCDYTMSFVPTVVGESTGKFSVYSSRGGAKVGLKGNGIGLPAAQFGPKKWHPGHYVEFGPGPSSRITKVYDVPEIQGGLNEYRWADVESEKGVYNFAVIDAELALWASKGKRLVIQIGDKTFGANDLKCVPGYMLTDPEYKGGQLIRTGDRPGCIAKRWLPEVMDRFIALHKALGERYDQHPFVEAIVTSETAISSKPSDGATLRMYVDQLKRLGAAFAEAYPHTLSAIWINWDTGTFTNELVEYLYQNGIGVGGPDSNPNGGTQLNPKYTSMYRGRLPILMGVQPSQILIKTRLIQDGLLTYDDVFRYVVDDPQGINATHAFWLWFKYETYDFWYTLDVIRANEARINSACPENLICNTEF